MGFTCLSKSIFVVVVEDEDEAIDFVSLEVGARVFGWIRLQVLKPSITIETTINKPIRTTAMLHSWVRASNLKKPALPNDSVVPASCFILPIG